MPASGYRNGTSLNNAGSNGNYWSSSLNTDDPANAWNLNFNSGSVNTNNNNRNNGQSVRPVTEFTAANASLPFVTTPECLLSDLYDAYVQARRHKRKKHYQVSFERHMESELIRLRNSIIEGRYIPGRSTCFIVHDPKMREVFAASFRDRVVHHLLYNYIRPFLERQFIDDSYSCIKKRGTHYGINRLEQHIREVSRNYSRRCYILKLDIGGYFMNIDRGRLLSICRQRLELSKNEMDWPLVDFLLERIILHNPVRDCFRKGYECEWEKLPPRKSLFHSPQGCGLPIGNLTSQLFSNVYMNELDQYVISCLGVKHYGRYVDDMFVVSDSIGELHRIAFLVESFLYKRLGLKLNPKKTRICSAYFGVEFLGAYLKPFRKYVENGCFKRMCRKMKRVEKLSVKRQWSSVNSYLGLTSHYFAYNIRKDWSRNLLASTFKYGYYCNHFLKFRLVSRATSSRKPAIFSGR